MKIEITILGLLMKENLYGYEIKRKIVESLEDYVDIKFGSIYYAIKKSVSNGWVDKAGTEKDSGNPERYVYEITPVGKKHFKKMLKQYFEDNITHFDIDIVLLFFNHLSSSVRDSFVAERLDVIGEKLQSIEKKLSEIKDGGKDGGKDEASITSVLKYIYYHLKAEILWLNEVGE